MKRPVVYMLASQRNGTLYIGVTADLIKRVWQHREGTVEGFTKKFSVKMLVWYEQHKTMESAICKEKTMKKWLRKWKLSTIEQFNPDWVDLWPVIIGQTDHPIKTAHPVKPASPVVPAVILADAEKAGTQQSYEKLDSRMRGNDCDLGTQRTIKGLI